MVVRANLLSSLQELLNLLSSECDAFGLGRFCRAREAAQTGRRVGLDKSLLDRVIEQAADDAQCVADGVAREIFADSVIDQGLDVIAPDLIDWLLTKSGAQIFPITSTAGSTKQVGRSATPTSSDCAFHTRPR